MTPRRSLHEKGLKNGEDGLRMRSRIRGRSGYGLYGGSRLTTLLLLLVITGSCVLAYRHFFQRQGEAAASLIPKDATMVTTVDLKPSPEQVATFTQIQDALRREHVSDQFDSMLTMMLSNSPVGKDLRPYVTTSMAFAALKPEAPGRPNDADGVGLFAVSDPGRVRDILARDARKTSLNGIDYYQVRPTDHIYMAVVGDYFVVAAKPADLMQVVRVHRGELSAISTRPDFQQARATLPADANLMLFIPSDSIRQAATTLAGRSADGHAPAVSWVVVGMTVRPTGIEVRTQIPYAAPAGSDLSAIAPLDMHLLNRLPPGAYGLIALSQPGKYWNSSLSAGSNAAPLMGGDQNRVNRSMNESIAAFERETGMSIPRDVLPGFHGDALLAIYPDSAGHPGADGLIVLDDANGANPAALADKVRAYIERQSAEHGHTAVHFNSQIVNGATVWTLDPGAQEQLRTSLDSAASQAQQNGMSAFVPTPPPGASQQPGMPGSMRSSQSVTINTQDGGTQTITTKPDGSMVITVHKADGSVETTMRGANGSMSTTVRQPDGSTHTTTFGGNGSASPMGAPAGPGATPTQHMFGNKTLIYAQVGHALLIASSQPMMDHALAAYQRGTGGLADDAAFAQMRRQAPPGAQSLLLIDLPGIMEAFRPELTRSMSNTSAGVTVDDVLHLFGQHTGIVGTQQYDGRVASGYFFMPLDYGKMIHLIGAAQRAAGGSNTMTPPVPPTPPANGSVVQ
jgi:hypothetical protein